MIAAVLTAVWTLGAIGVFAVMVWALPYRIPIARWSLVVVGSITWPIVLVVGIALAFVSVVTDDGRGDLEGLE